MGTPLELVQYDANTKKFVVGKAALETLRSVKGPMGVVAVCGRARQGKSYILNQLLQTTGGFTVRGSCHHGPAPPARFSRTPSPSHDLNLRRADVLSRPQCRSDPRTARAPRACGCGRPPRSGSLPTGASTTL